MKRSLQVYKVAVLVVAVFITGCASKVPIPKDRSILDPDEAWARVLKKYVDKEGRTNFTALSKDRADIEQVVHYVSVESPKSKPEAFLTKNDQLAYYINTYNALAMYNVIRNDIPSDQGSFFKRFGFFYNTKFSIGGEYMSLYSLENDIVRKLGDARIHVALNCMVVGCPRLPQVPFKGKTLDTFLTQLAKEFYNSTKHVRVDQAEKKVHVSEILDFYTDDFLKEEATLVAYINKFRKNKIPKDYEVEFIDYDWTTNNQPGTLAKK